MKSLALWTLVATTFSLVGCSPANVTSPAASSCATYAYAFCAYLERCSATAVQLRFGTSAACEQLKTASCESAVTAPASGATPTTVAACTQVLTDPLPTWTCADLPFRRTLPPPVAR